ncbi:MAG TPA: RNA-binding domain-containing protein [Candidatus Thermoplasmatota archaeon]|nr:RNA-binding domain-containing protein [Candidatus Thermoplasmatota archaeon]
MAVFHYLHLRAFAHETEDAAKVVGALRTAAQDEHARFEETRADGSHGNRILILDGEVKSAPAAKRVFGALQRDDPAGYEELVRTARQRVDENLNLHFRLDKQEAAQGRVMLAKDDDAITVRGKLRSFESKRSGAGLEDSLQQLEALFLGMERRRQTIGQ